MEKQKKRQPKTRLHFSCDQKVRVGQEYLSIKIWSAKPREEGAYPTKDFIHLHKALKEGEPFDVQGDHIITTIQCILQKYLGKYEVGKIYPERFRQYLFGSRGKYYCRYCFEVRILVV